MREIAVPGCDEPLILPSASLAEGTGSSSAWPVAGTVHVWCDKPRTVRGDVDAAQRVTAWLSGSGLARGRAGGRINRARSGIGEVALWPSRVTVVACTAAVDPAQRRALDELTAAWAADQINAAVAGRSSPGLPPRDLLIMGARPQCPPPATGTARAADLDLVRRGCVTALAAWTGRDVDVELMEHWLRYGEPDSLRYLLEADRVPRAVALYAGVARHGLRLPLRRFADAEVRVVRARSRSGFHDGLYPALAWWADRALRQSSR